MTARSLRMRSHDHRFDIMSHRETIPLLKHLINALAKGLGFLSHCSIANTPDNMACIDSSLQDNTIPPESAGLQPY